MSPILHHSLPVINFLVKANPQDDPFNAKGLLRFYNISLGGYDINALRASGILWRRTDIVA